MNKLTTEVRVRLGLSSDPPETCEEVEAESAQIKALIDRAHRDAVRSGRNWAIAATIPIAVVQIALYLVGVNAIFLALTPWVVAPVVTVALMHIMRRR